MRRCEQHQAQCDSVLHKVGDGAQRCAPLFLARHRRVVRLLVPPLFDRVQVPPVKDRRVNGGAWLAVIPVGILAVALTRVYLARESAEAARKAAACERAARRAEEARQRFEVLSGAAGACETCGETFAVAPLREPRPRYCSAECRREAHRAKKRREYDPDEHWERAELIKLVAKCTLSTLAIILGGWFFSRSSEQTQVKVGSIIVLLVVSFAFLAVVVLVLYYWSMTDRTILPAIGLGLLFAFYVYLLAASVFFVIDEFFATNFERSWASGEIPKRLQEPFTATLGAILLLVSLFLFWAIVTTEGGWAERADSFKCFVAFFLGGISILATSEALDPLVGTNLGNSLRSHLGHWGQHAAELIVDLGAIAVASIAALFFPSKRH
jgi:hypothetical protein